MNAMLSEFSPVHTFATYVTAVLLEFKRGSPKLLFLSKFLQYVLGEFAVSGTCAE
jgi:hypothetical protein